MACDAWVACATVAPWQQAQTLTLDVGFYYERYRFYGKQILDDDGRAFYFNTGASDDSPLPIPGQSINDPNPATQTSNNVTSSSF